MTVHSSFRNGAETGDIQSAPTFFQKMFAGFDEPTLPFGLFTRDASPLQQSSIELDANLAQRLREQAQNREVSAESLCHFAWALVLARFSGCNDVVFGTALGALGNILPFRIKVSDATVETIAHTIHERLAEVSNHGRLSFPALCDTISLPAPLFAAVFTYHRASDEAASSNACGEFGEAENAESYPLSIVVDERDEGFQLTALAQTPVEPERVCDFMQSALAQLVETLEAAPDTAAQAIDVLPAAERHKVLFEWNATEADYPYDKCIHELFELQVARTPDAAAVVHKDRHLTYAELNAKANRLAHYLRGLGVKPDARVAICVERSFDMVVGLLAILKAGGAYVPLDPAYPVERLAFMLKDSEPLALLTGGQAKTALKSHTDKLQVIDLELDAPLWANQLDTNPDCASLEMTSRQLAYVIYTSGSTGMPKGAMNEHRGVVNRLLWMQSEYGLDVHDAVLQKTPFSFDVSVWEFFWPLMTGARLVMARPEGHKDPAYLAEIIQSENITTLHFVPSMLQLFLDSDVAAKCLGIVRVMCSGEALPASLVHRFHERLPGVELHNLYGPTEAAVDVTAWPCLPDGKLTSVPIGRPIANTQIYILDARGQPTPIGVAGEIFIGGVQVGRGYLNRPELTAERFLLDPFAKEPNARMYRTGDLGRWRADGAIEYLGRNDFQVKIRGFRIELGEIEARLTKHPGVREAIVVAHEDTPGDKRLVAYYTGEAGVDARDLRAHLTAALPDYMAPAIYVRLDALPLNANGKLDRQALPAPEGEAFGAREYEAPSCTMEETLAGIWATLLKVERVGRHDNFFDLGGHSLLAVQVLSRVRQALGVEAKLADVFAWPVLGDFATLLGEAAGAVLTPIPAVDRTKPIPLSFAQQRLWFLAQLEGASEAYHVPLNLTLTGRLDREALRRALDRIVDRHEALRTTFEAIGGEPVQRIAAAETGFALIEHDLRGRSDITDELKRLAEEEAAAPFDLSGGPLIRGRLVQEAAQEHTLLITMHHIVSDGWSMAVFMDELKTLYTAFLNGEANPLPSLPVQYAEFAAWERAALANSEMAEQQAAYWKKALAGAPALLELPADRPRPAQQDYAGAMAEVDLDAELTRRLRDLSKRHGVTLYVTFLAAWAALMGRLSGQEDVVIGSPAANRGRAEFEPLIGFFVNTLPMRIDLSGDLTVGELLARVKKQALAAQQHQDLPFEQVVEAVQPQRSLAYSPLFQVMFAWQNTPRAAFELPGLRVASIAVPHATAQFDLVLSLDDSDGCIRGFAEYATSLFERETIERYLGYWKHLLESMAADEGEQVGRLTLLSEAERHQVLVEWNATEADYPRDRCVHELFEAQAAKTPDAVAIVHGDRNLTYAELNAKANRLAHYLRGLGVKPDARVAICVERTFDMVAAVLAVWKAGGAYVPLDPAYPVERLSYMLADCGAVVLLADARGSKALGDHAKNVPLIDFGRDSRLWESQPDSNLDRISIGLLPQHLSYVIYTSGSTGAPKGVMVEHRGVCNLALAQIKAFLVEPESRVLQFSSFSFDACASELVMTLCRGAALILPPPESIMAGAVLIETLARHDVTHATLPPAVLSALQEDSGSDLGLVHTLIVAGEAPTAEMVKRWGEKRRFINAYGPTETSVCATTYECRSAEKANPPIGRPIANTQIYILDANLQPAPIGVTGEIYIGGAGVARGYLNRPELTAERFLLDPFAKEPNARMYRTGDLGRWRADGAIEYLGRNDFQVKIRGFRIELGEIEARLREHPGVREAMVVAREDTPGDKRLVAYYTGEAGLEARDLRAHLTAALPDYMAPAIYVRLDALPLNANGKVDRRALPAPEGEAFGAREYEAPVTTTEQNSRRDLGRSAQGRARRASR